MWRYCRAMKVAVVFLADITKLARHVEGIVAFAADPEVTSTSWGAPSPMVAWIGTPEPRVSCGNELRVKKRFATIVGQPVREDQTHRVVGMRNLHQQDRHPPKCLKETQWLSAPMSRASRYV